MANGTLLIAWRRRWNRSLFQFLGRRVRATVDIEDLAQETYLRLLRARDLSEVRTGKPHSRSTIYKIVLTTKHWAIRLEATGMGIPGIGSSVYREDIELNRPPNLGPKAQADLTHANRVAAIGQLSVSIVHEVTQPISASLYNAQTALEGLNAPSPDVEGARLAVSRIVRDCNRAVTVLGSIRSMVKKTPPSREVCQLNEAIAEVVELTYGEAIDNLVSVTTELANPLPVVRADRIELQQLILNLVLNGIEAMSSVIDGPRTLQIRTTSDSNSVVVSVEDSGPGMNSTTIDRLFEPYYTTKANGLGMGLWICRSIVERHRGRLWAAPNGCRGATFSFSLPLDGLRRCSSRGGRGYVGQKKRSDVNRGQLDSRLGHESDKSSTS
jgi:signal transduction histidine kinase